MDNISARLSAFLQIQQAPVRSPGIGDNVGDNIGGNSVDKAENGLRLKPDIVALSDEGKRRAAADDGQQNISASQTQNIAQMIREIQTKIADLRQQIGQLKNQQDDTSQKRLDDLNQQLLGFERELATLNNKKLMASRGI